MKNKLIVSVVSIAVVGIAAFSFSTKVVERAYQPKPYEGPDATSWKGASELYGMLTADVNTGEYNPEAVLAARKQVEERSAKGSRASLGLSWKEQGPDNVGGRTRAMIIDKDDNQTLFIGSVAGGMYKSTDAAATWTRMQSFDDVADVLNASPAVSTIAQGPNGEIYVGTGCTFEPYGGVGNTGQLGRGIFKSTDRGETWTVLQSTHPGEGNFTSSADWTFVNRIAVDQNNGDVYAAMNKGLKKSTDGGETWTDAVHADTNCQFPQTSVGHDVKVTEDGVVLAVLGGNLYRSETGDLCTFDKIDGITGSRLSIAVSKADENYVYGLGTVGDAANIFKSSDKGLTWEVLQAPIAGYFELDTQGDYDVAIGASAHDPEDVIVGGVQLWRHNGNLVRIAAEFPGPGLYQYLVHSDKHDVVFDETDPNIVYVLSDGGVGKSIDGGNIWFEANRGYNVTQFYSVAYDNDGKMMAGAQDNGTQEVTGKEFYPMSANEISGGDGFDCEYSQITDVRFASIYYEEIRRGIDGSDLGAICTTDQPGPTCGSGSFFTKMRIWETLNDPKSQAVVAFENSNAPQGIKKGDGTSRKFTGDFDHPKAGGVFVKGGFRVYVGTEGTSSYQEVTDSATTATTGLFVGAGGSVGTINYSTGEFEVTFGSAPTETQTVWGEFQSMYPMGTTIALNSNTGTNQVQIPLDYKLPANLNPGETVLVPDPVQSIFAVNDGSSVAITREALDISKIPTWLTISGISGGAFAIEFSSDGDHLFVGTNNGTLYRVSNLSEVYTQEDLNDLATVTQIGSFGAVVAGVAIDPNNANNVVVTMAGYGGTTKVSKSTNALSSSPSFTNATGDLPIMPCYDVIIDVYDSNKVVIGTEYGMWATDDIWGSSVEWTDESGELGNVQVYAVRQQTHPWEITHNKGEIYLGTHARGMWRSGTLVSSTDFNDVIEEGNADFVNSLNVYPNPMNETGFVSFNLDNNSQGKVTVFDINGRSIETRNISNLVAGDNKLQLDVNNYEMGTYFVTLEVEGERKLAKFVVL